MSAATEAVAAEALAAADAIVERFGAHDTAGYFAGFAPDATFLFHTTHHRLESRAEYQELWAQWEREDGFRVLACRSTNQRVQVLGPDAAVFSHDVETESEAGGERSTIRERETIVLERRDGRWLCVHEHLSGLD